FKANHEVVRVTNDDDIAPAAVLPPPFDPQVEDVMQEHVRQQRRNHRSLRRAYFGLRPLTRFADPGPQPLADQPKNPWIADAMLQKLDQPRMVDVVEEAFDVGIQYPIHPFAGQSHTQRIQRLMTT